MSLIKPTDRESRTLTAHFWCWWIRDPLGSISFTDSHLRATYRVVKRFVLNIQLCVVLVSLFRPEICGYDDVERCYKNFSNLCHLLVPSGPKLQKSIHSDKEVARYFRDGRWMLQDQGKLICIKDPNKHAGQYLKNECRRHRPNFFNIPYGTFGGPFSHCVTS